MDLKLLVIRTNQMEVLVKFYQLFGLEFEYHQHNNSPFHFAANIGEMVFEIYPLAKNQLVADNNLRLGFSIDNFEEFIDTLTKNECKFTSPTQTDFGFLTIVTDPDGRKIEVYKK